MRTITIDTPDDPRIADYIGVREAWLREPGLAPAPDSADTNPIPNIDRTFTPSFMAEGIVVLQQMARSGITPISVLVTPTRLETSRHILEQLVAGSFTPPPIYLATPPVIDAIAGFHIHRGLLALGRRPASTSPIELLSQGRKTFVIAEDLANHDNLGLIFRSTAALAGPNSAVLLSPSCADPLYRKSLRVSVGCALAIPHARVTPWPDGLRHLTTAGVQIVALALGPNSRPIAEVARQIDLKRPIALLVGAEGPGLTPEALAIATHSAQIPIWSGVDSLNVGVAASIALAILINNNTSDIHPGEPDS